MIRIRKTKEELLELQKKYGIDKFWSFSRVDQYLTSKYVYYLNYIKHERKDAEQSIYGIMGGLIHDTVEDLYLGNINKNDLLDRFESFWSMNIDMLDIKFDRTDSEKNSKIKSKYYECLKHFMMNHELINDEMITEQFITIKIGDNYFQGYIDACTKDKNGIFTIIDWKTSTIFAKKDIPKKSRQLLLYSLGLHQKGVPLEKIKCCFNFLKYVSVDFEQINGKHKIIQIERNKIGERLVASANRWLKKLDYSEDKVKEFNQEMILSNSLDCLPNEVQSKFSIHDCYIYIEANELLLNELENDLIKVCKEIDDKTDEYLKTYDDKIFWDDEESIKKQEYYYYNLCDYTPNKVRPFKEYLESIEKKKQENDLLAFVDNNDSKNADSDNEDWLKGLFA